MQILKPFRAIESLVVGLFKYHFQALPSITHSGVRWGTLQVYLSVALFFVALYFPFQHKAGEPMSVGNWFGYVFLVIGGLLVAYCSFIAYKFLRAGSLIGTPQDSASKQDITDLRRDLVSAINKNTRVITKLVNEIREDREKRNGKE